MHHVCVRAMHARCMLLLAEWLYLLGWIPDVHNLRAGFLMYITCVLDS
jgi:hypothetical protein